MTTLNQIAENIAYKLGDQFNLTLRESIKDTVIIYRAKFIRDDLDKNFLSESHFSQVGTIQFEVVNLLEEFNADFSNISAICANVTKQDKYKILRSKQLIPTSVRTKVSSRNPFLFLGKVDGSKNFTFTTLDKYYYYQHIPYQENNIFYIYLNNRIYIINNLNLCDINESLNISNVMIKGIFENPRELYNACVNNDTYMDDMPFPIGLDMLMSITNNILKGEYPIKVKDGEQVNIHPDDNE
jgi:hypothetical protein